MTAGKLHVAHTHTDPACVSSGCKFKRCRESQGSDSNVRVKVNNRWKRGSRAAFHVWFAVNPTCSCCPGSTSRQMSVEFIRVSHVLSTFLLLPLTTIALQFEHRLFALTCIVGPYR